MDVCGNTHTKKTLGSEREAFIMHAQAQIWPTTTTRSI